MKSFTVSRSGYWLQRYANAKQRAFFRIYLIYNVLYMYQRVARFARAARPCRRHCAALRAAQQSTTLRVVFIRITQIYLLAALAPIIVYFYIESEIRQYLHCECIFSKNEVLTKTLPIICAFFFLSINTRNVLLFYRKWTLNAVLSE